MRNKLIAIVAAVVAAVSVAAASPAHVAERRNPPCLANDPYCSPGPGWAQVWIKHVSSGECIFAGGNVLAQAIDEPCGYTGPLGWNGIYWWTRLINGNERQFARAGDDGYFHELGYSGGNFKTETASDSVYWVEWDQSNGAWSYANSAVTYFAGDPGCDGCYIKNDTSPFTHWLLVAWGT